MLHFADRGAINGLNPVGCHCCKLRAAEEMEKALKDIRSLSSISSAINPNPFALTALLAGIHHIADTALAQEDRND